jgi:hypothetical protein
MYSKNTKQITVIGSIKVLQRSNVVKSELFSPKLKDLMKEYNSRMIYSAEVIEVLLDLCKDIVSSVKEGMEKAEGAVNIVIKQAELMSAGI